MPRTRRHAAKDVCDEASTGMENMVPTAAATTRPVRYKRTFSSTEMTEPSTLVAQSTVVNPPSKKARKGGDVACAETLVQMNQGKRERGNRDRGRERVQREELAAIDINKRKFDAPQRSSVFAYESSSSLSFYPRRDGSSSHIPGPFDTDSDQGDASDVEAEEDWFGPPQDVQPEAPAASKMSLERPSWLGEVNTPAPTSSPLNSGETTEPDDRQGNASGTTNTNLVTVTQPTWPVETDLCFVTGTNRVKLSLQPPLLQAIFHDAFKNVRSALLFGYAFPDAIAIPKVVRRSIIAAADGKRFSDGRHNPLAAAIHERLLTDGDYLSKMVRLPRARIPIFRGELKDRCAQIVQVTFLSFNSPGTVIDTVTKELTNYTYTCPIFTSFGAKGVPMRTKLYRNQRIVAVLRNSFFVGGTSAYAHRYFHKFPRTRGTDGVIACEIPVPMLALVATALYAAIHEWRTGVYQATEFSTEAYVDAYNGHIGTLDHIKEHRPQAFHTMMAHLYSLASASTDDPPALPIANINVDELDG